jgi:FkbM family methyltransferase
MAWILLLGFSCTSIGQVSLPHSGDVILSNSGPDRLFWGFVVLMIMSEFKRLWRPIGASMRERLWTLLLASAGSRRTALRSLFERHMAPNALGYIEFDDHAFFVDPRDQIISFRLLTGHSWQREEFTAALQATQAAGVLQPGKWFLDIGANIGTQTVYAMRSGLFCGVIAMEPEPHNLDLLRRNVAVNGLSDKVHVVGAAASSANDRASLTRDRQNFGAHSIQPDWSGTPGAAVAVATRTVDEVLASLNLTPADVGLIWIDVEGHEIAAMQGMRGLRAAQVPIVSEISMTQHGPGDVATLRAMLAEDYTSVRHLQPRDAHGRVLTADVVPATVPQGVPQGVPDTEPESVAEFQFGARQTDVLIFNANRAQGRPGQLAGQSHAVSAAAQVR